jgi:hypothetical protein
MWLKAGYDAVYGIVIDSSVSFGIVVAFSTDIFELYAILDLTILFVLFTRSVLRYLSQNVGIFSLINQYPENKQISVFRSNRFKVLGAGLLFIPFYYYSIFNVIENSYIFRIEQESLNSDQGDQYVLAINRSGLLGEDTIFKCIKKHRTSDKITLTIHKIGENIEGTAEFLLTKENLKDCHKDDYDFLELSVEQEKAFSYQKAYTSVFLSDQ